MRAGRAATQNVPKRRRRPQRVPTDARQTASGHAVAQTVAPPNMAPAGELHRTAAELRAGRLQAGGETADAGRESDGPFRAGAQAQEPRPRVPAHRAAQAGPGQPEKTPKQRGASENGQGAGQSGGAGHQHQGQSRPAGVSHVRNEPRAQFLRGAAKVVRRHLPQRDYFESAPASVPLAQSHQVRDAGGRRHAGRLPQRASDALTQLDARPRGAPSARGVPAKRGDGVGGESSQAEKRESRRRRSRSARQAAEAAWSALERFESEDALDRGQAVQESQPLWLAQGTEPLQGWCCQPFQAHLQRTKSCEE